MATTTPVEDDSSLQPLVVQGILALLLLLAGYYRVWVYHAIKTIPRDVRALWIFIEIKLVMGILDRQRKTIPTLFEEVALKFSTKTAIIFEGRHYSFIEIHHQSNKIANFFYRKGFRKGDVIALFMDQRPEFVITWLGLTKIGVQVALINFNVREAGLCHSINCVEPRGVIVGAELAAELSGVAPKLSTKNIWITGAKDTSWHNLDSDLEDESTAVEYGRPDCGFHDKLLYIYTSGTTGLPKAAIVRNDRYFYQYKAIQAFFSIRPEDVIYTCLPIYHSAGGVLGIGNMLLGGTTVVIRRKFSARSFFRDCFENQCTVVQYIGEIVRYLNSTPPSEYDRRHRVRIAVGNGLNTQVWKEFQSRFGIPVVGEFYGATEGNTSMVNFSNKVGACGFNSIILPFVYPVRTIRFDVELEMPVRGKDGFCIPCKPGEIGELIGFVNMKDPLRKFDGYVGQAESNKKVLRDVFRRGDAWFRTGDLLIMDHDGFYYFKDRIGDTFRWKGENVSTAEVEETVVKILQNGSSVAVYGVKVPGADGRAGMLAIKGLQEQGIVALYDQLKDKLPRYAIPLFVRLLSSMETTGTHKIIKTSLKADSFDLDKVRTDPVFVLDRENGKYVKLSPDAFATISSGKAKW